MPRYLHKSNLVFCLANFKVSAGSGSFFAALKYKYQKRKDCDKTPYINHPIALMNLLANGAGITDPEILCAALLHDMIARYQCNVRRAYRGIWRVYRRYCRGSD